MRADLLWEHFDTLIKAPEDVKALEAAILDLAVHGKLVLQDPEDEPARMEPSDYSLVSSFDIPLNWRWCTLGDIVLDLRNGTSTRKSSEKGRETIVVRLADIVDGEISTADPRRIRLPESQVSKYELREHDILVTRVNGSVNLVGNFTLVRSSDGLAYCDHFVRMRVDAELVDPLWLVRIGRSRFMRDQIEQRFVTTAGQKTVNQRHISSLTIPLPPLAEQKRIAKGVESILAYTTELTAQLQIADDVLAPAAQATFQALVAAPDRAARRKAWQRIEDGFEALTSDPRTIDALKETILDLAVRGLLVPQDPRDEPADQLTTPTRTDQLAFDGIPKLDSLAPSGSDLVASSLPRLPEPWTWMRLEDACEAVVDCLHSTPHFVEKGWMCVDTTCIEPGRILFDQVRFVDRTTFDDRNRRLVPEEGDVLFSREGTIGVAVVVPPKVDICLGQRMMIFRVKKSILPGYFELALTSNVLKAQYLPKVSGTASPHLNIRDIRQLLLPIPPQDEQWRIVSKVTELCRLCASLAKEDSLTEHARERGLQAVLNGAGPTSWATTFS